MKKKIVSLCLAVALAAVGVTGATLAYFTDTESADNVFTLGSVDIALHEANTGENAVSDEAYQSWLAGQKLIPSPDGTKNAIDKVVTIENTGSNSAYVWAEILVPAAVDGSLRAVNGQNTINADIYKSNTTKVINNVTYDVYYSIAPTALAPEATSINLLEKVYMEGAVKQCTDPQHEDCLVLKNGTHYDGTWDVIVNAVAIQSEGFDTVLDAFKAYYAA